MLLETAAVVVMSARSNHVDRLRLVAGCDARCRVIAVAHFTLKDCGPDLMPPNGVLFLGGIDR